MKLKSILISALMAVALPAAANAVTFDFTDPAVPSAPNTFESLSFTEEGLTVTATAVNNFGGAGLVANRFAGLGVAGFPEDSRIAQNELLVLSFSEEVTITTGSFFQQGGEEEPFFIGADMVDLFTSSIPALSPTGFVSLDDLGFTSLTGTEFVFGTGVLPGPGALGLELADLGVTRVPLPAPLAMLLVALAGFGFVARRRRAVATA